MLIIKDVAELNIEEIIECLKIYNETGIPQMEGDILKRISELWEDLK